MNKMKKNSTSVTLVVFLILFSFALNFPSKVFADQSAEKTSVDVRIQWEDSENPTCERSKYVTIKLFANDINTGKELKLSESNNWSGTFTDLDKYEGGEEIVYTISECNVCDDYSCVVSGDASTGFIVVNCSAISCISVVVDEAAEGLRPHHIAGLAILFAVGLLFLVARVRKRKFS